jgi:hypothetical protein
VPAADWTAYQADDEVRESLLDAVARHGAGLLSTLAVLRRTITAR